MERKSKLLANNNVRFALVSIGKPEIGMELCAHLGIKDGEEWIFADPENDAYDRLELNRGWETMINPATAFRFRDRIFGGGKGSMNQVRVYVGIVNNVVGFVWMGNTLIFLLRCDRLSSIYYFYTHIILVVSISLWNEPAL